MERAILCALAIGAVLGGLDLLIGNRFKLGERFEEGFKLLGPTALSRAGILCLAPLLSGALESTLAPLWRALGLDPAMLGGILAIDMGGYQTAELLAQDAAIGRYAGILVAATLGCTVTFTIPLGAGMLRGLDAAGFYRGLLIGLGTLPVALLLGGAVSGIALLPLLIQTLPVALFSLLLMLGLKFFAFQSIRAFSAFAALLRWLSIIGLTAGAVQYIAGVALIPNLAPIEEAMKTVSGIGIVMLGSLPAAEVLRRVLSRPLMRLGQKFGMTDASLAALLVGFVSITPVLAMMKEMDLRGQTMNAAFAVCAASALAAHLGFTLSAAPQMILPLLLTKLFGGVFAAVLAVLLTKEEGKGERASRAD